MKSFKSEIKKFEKETKMIFKGYAIWLPHSHEYLLFVMENKYIINWMWTPIPEICLIFENSKEAKRISSEKDGSLVVCVFENETDFTIQNFN